jgi:RNA polymerase sigma factor (sigma-70 family)
MEPRVIPISGRPVSARARVWSLQPDAILCRAARHGNELAFSELHRRHYPALRAFIFHLLGSRHRHEDAEDVVQDSFARAFDSIAEGRFEGDFRRWLFVIARNRSIDLLRGERVRLVSLESAAVESDPPRMGESLTTAAVAETHDELAWLVAEIEHLPERQRSALLLRELAGLSHEAIAEEIGTTSASVRQLITRARSGIRSAAERDGREHEAAPSRSLRSELLDAVPMLPLGAAGIAASAGSAAGGSLAAGKLVATLLAAIVLAATAGPAARDVADASDSHGRAGTGPALTLGDPFSATALPAQENLQMQSGSRSDSKLDAGTLPTRAKHHAQSQDGARPAEGSQEGASEKPAARESPANPVPEATKPLKPVVELPGKAIEHVTSGLNGSSPPQQVVEDVVNDVTGTLDETTSGLLGSR